MAVSQHVVICSAQPVARENIDEIPSSNNLHRVCRICLEMGEGFTSLFSADEASKAVLENIFLCFQLVLTQEDHLPSAICSECVEELNVANRFRLKCIAFEERFSAFCNKLSKVEQEDNSLEHVGSDDHESDEECNNVSSIPDADPKGEKVSDSVKKPHFQCDACLKILKTKASLTSHIISMHKLRKHVGRVTGSGSNRRYHCTKCEFSTPHSQTLVNHDRRHNGERPYHCKCGKSFTQISSLSAHKKIHEDTTNFTCSICGKQFKHAFSLKGHLRVHEPGNYPCSICPKVLKTKKTLRDHMHRHNNVRNYNCEECGATFVALADLHNHKKSHSVEKSAECHLCGFKTRTKKNLIMHLKRHVGEKTIKCGICPVTVYTSTDLRRHRRVHSREKPYQCPACSQKFAHSPSLNRHMKNVHGMNYVWGDSKPVKPFYVKQEKESVDQNND